MARIKSGDVLFDLWNEMLRGVFDFLEEFFSDIGYENSWECSQMYKVWRGGSRIVSIRIPLGEIHGIVQFEMKI